MVVLTLLSNAGYTVKSYPSHSLSAMNLSLPNFTPTNRYSHFVSQLKVVSSEIDLVPDKDKREIISTNDTLSGTPFGI